VFATTKKSLREEGDGYAAVSFICKKIDKGGGEGVFLGAETYLKILGNGQGNEKFWGGGGEGDRV